MVVASHDHWDSQAVLHHRGTCDHEKVEAPYNGCCRRAIHSEAPVSGMGTSPLRMNSCERSNGWTWVIQRLGRSTSPGCLQKLQAAEFATLVEAGKDSPWGNEEVAPLDPRRYLTVRYHQSLTSNEGAHYFVERSCLVVLDSLERLCRRPRRLRHHRLPDKDSQVLGLACN